MRYFFYIIFLYLFSCSAGKEVVMDRYSDGVIAYRVLYDRTPGKNVIVSEQRYYESGELRELTTYSNGKKDSIMQWHPNGQVAMVRNLSEEGSVDGKEVLWYENGQKSKEILWDKGMKIKESAWYRDGSVKYKSDWKTGVEVSFYRNGHKKKETQWTGMQECFITDDSGNVLVKYFGRLRDGVEREWYESGVLRSEGVWRLDRQEGKWTVWYPNGQKKEEGNYAGGEYEVLPVLSSNAIPDFIPHKDGKWGYWNSDGMKVREELWEKGELKEGSDY